MTPNPYEHRSFGSKVLTFLKRLVITGVVLGLTGATVFLLSQLNAKSFSLVQQDGKLVVFKGRMMPTGSEPWLPADAALAEAYAPLELDGTSPTGAVGLKYDDRDTLDRALFSVIETLARPKVASDDSRQLDLGLMYLRRAEKLKGLTGEQLLALKTMKTDVAYYTARRKLEEGQRQVEDALAQLKIAADTDNRHARSANQMIVAVEPQARALAEALRTAVNSLSAPAAVAAPVAPAPAPAGPDAGR